MSRFVFNLQRVLDLRLQSAEEARIYLENCKKIVSELKRVLIEERDSYLLERDQLNESIRNGAHFK